MRCLVSETTASTGPAGGTALAVFLFASRSALVRASTLPVARATTTRAAARAADGRRSRLKSAASETILCTPIPRTHDLGVHYTGTLRPAHLPNCRGDVMAWTHVAG